MYHYHLIPIAIKIYDFYYTQEAIAFQLLIFTFIINLILLFLKYIISMEDKKESICSFEIEADESFSPQKIYQFLISSK
jgi:hypothetical protein